MGRVFGTRVSPTVPNHLEEVGDGLGLDGSDGKRWVTRPTRRDDGWGWVGWLKGGWVVLENFPVPVGWFNSTRIPSDF